MTSKQDCEPWEKERSDASKVQGAVNNGTAKGRKAAKSAPPSLASLYGGHPVLLVRPPKVQASLAQTYLLEVNIRGQGPHSVCLLCPFPPPPSPLLSHEQDLLRTHYLIDLD